MDVRNLKKDVWPYQIKIEIPNVETVRQLLAPDDWCTQTVGRRFVDWYSYNLTNHTRVFAFKDEATLLVFKLTWGNYGIK